jgi:hypothetical protein
VVEMDSKFYFRNGEAAEDIPSFIAIIEHIDEDTFAYHCNKDKNDFYNWINDCVSPKLAKKVKSVKSKKALAKKLKETL